MIALTTAFIVHNFNLIYGTGPKLDLVPDRNLLERIAESYILETLCCAVSNNDLSLKSRSGGSISLHEYACRLTSSSFILVFIMKPSLKAERSFARPRDLFGSSLHPSPSLNQSVYC